MRTTSKIYTTSALLLNLLLGQGGIAQSTEGSPSVQAFAKAFDSQCNSVPSRCIQAFVLAADSLRKSTMTSPIDDAYLLYTLAKYHFKNFENDAAKQVCLKGIKFANKNRLDKPLAGFYNILGATLVNENKADSAALYFVKAAENLERHNDVIKAGFVYNNIANIYMDAENYERAVQYLNKSKKLLKDDTTHIPTIYGNMSFCYAKLDSLLLADNYANLAIELGQKYRQGNGIVYGKLTKGDLAIKQHNTKLATHHYEEAYTSALALDDTYRQALAGSYLCEYYKESDPAKAIYYGEKAYKIFTETEPRFIPNLTKTISEAYANKGQMKPAFRYQTLYISYLDSLKRDEFQKTQLELLEKYETEKKSKLIAEQQAGLAHKDLKNAQLYFLVSGLLALLLGVSWLFTAKQRQAKAKIHQLQQEKENTFVQAYIEGEAQERLRLSNELHDGIANDIAATKMFVASQYMINPNNSEMIPQLEAQLDTIYHNTRSLSHTMTDAMFQEKSLAESIQILMDKYAGKIRTTFDFHSFKDTIPSTLKHVVFRIVQELVSNAAKHANASQIDVILSEEAKTLIVTVKDDGSGMTQKQIDNGLTFLRRRLNIIGAEMSINTNKGMGTCIQITISYEV